MDLVLQEYNVDKAFHNGVITQRYNSNVHIFVDSETGVNYFMCSTMLCPRYNADGTLFTSEIKAPKK